MYFLGWPYDLTVSTGSVVIHSKYSASIIVSTRPQQTGIAATDICHFKSVPYAVFIGIKLHGSNHIISIVKVTRQAYECPNALSKRNQ